MGLQQVNFRKWINGRMKVRSPCKTVHLTHSRGDRIANTNREGESSCKLVQRCGVESGRRCENFQQTTSGSLRFRLPPLLSRSRTRARNSSFFFLNTKKLAPSTQSVLSRHERCNLQPVLPLCHAKLTSCQPRLERDAKQA